MKISALRIDNFKTIKHLEVEEIENAFILVGKTALVKLPYWMLFVQLWYI